MPTPFTTEFVRQLALQHYGIQVSVKKMAGELDLNFQLLAENGELFTLKIANPAEKRENLEFQHALMAHLTTHHFDLKIPRVIPDLKGAFIVDLNLPDAAPRMMRLLSWIEGRCLADVAPHSPELLENLGLMCGKLSASLQTFDHPAAHRFLKWDPAQADWAGQWWQNRKDNDQREKPLTALYDIWLAAGKLLPQLRKSVCYADANDYNVLVQYENGKALVPGVIDFGDAVYTYTINELAIAATYAAMHKADPLGAIASVVRGYHHAFPLQEAEIEALWPMIAGRLLISLTCAEQNQAEHPDNTYLQISAEPAWALLDKMLQISPAFAHYLFRDACGWEACPKHQKFQNWLSQQSTPVPIVDGLFDQNGQAQIHWLDLSVGSLTLGNHADVLDAKKMDRLVQDDIDQSGYQIALGRYDEVRPFYTTDAYEVRGNNGPQWRTVHIGLDIFMPATSNVYAPFAGKVHSFQNNVADRDYGPTIILEHEFGDGDTFYSLYGHLTENSLDNLSIGQSFKAGELLCWIGDMPVNGNWPPHLHFQLMLDMLGKKGDYPGVGYPEQRSVWKSICPDPWLLIAGKPTPAIEAIPAPEILDFRRKHLGKNLSVSYARPLKILRGYRQYLFDDTGRRYLDTVNNVAHVGHEHPRVVRAGQRQMAVLNTNTRYLHENIVHFAEELLQTMPASLEVAFLVNSGSEANELALRLAKTYTGRKDMIAIEVGYHGNTNACVEVSSYKFDGPGGQGRPAHTHIVPIPDLYRGIYRKNDPEAGLKYALHVQEAAANASANGGLAGFIAEPVISCGGQVCLPQGYLKKAYEFVRAAGGVCIADEVQTGCGRHGQYFWAFEAHGVTPDIVTIGKPIGNGHPLGVVVTTRAIADAFANGMEYFNTFGGNPVSAAIGLEVLRVMKAEQLQQHALETGAYLSKQLQELTTRFPIIGDVRGPGLFLGFELVTNPITLDPAALQAAYLSNRMRELGILMSIDGPHHNVLKIKPPLVFGRKDADFLTEMLEIVLKEDLMQID